MEENRRFSWSDLFIKVIIVVLFVLFTIWLLSLSNKGLSNSLDVLTNNIFSENIEKMKEAGKGYFTTERLPKKIGDVKTLTLKEMYEKKLILELKDKFGNACDAKDSYVSIEKMENEYQMKINLECGEEEDYIIVIMGCYDYCDTDICEKDVTIQKETEYEYKKTTGGKWTDYGRWSEWSKIAVTKNNYRQVETKIEKEDYSYDKTITETVYASFDAKCPSGYEKTSDGTKCYKEVSTTSTANPTCPTVSGYILVNRDGFNCSYSKTTTSTANATCPAVSGYTLVNRDGFSCSYSKTTISTKDPVCPTVSGYTYTGRNGFNCNYKKTTTSTKSPICPTVSGYTYTGRNGFNCNYKKTTTSTKDPVCPTVSGYTYTGRNGFTCNYSKESTSYELEYVTTKKGSYVPKNTDKYAYKEYGTAEYVYDCNNECAFRWIHTYKVYKKVYTTETTTKIASCPSGYSKSGNSCVKSITDTTSKAASCPSGYSKSGNNCVKSITDTTSKTASCPTGYSNVNGVCTKSVTDTTSKTASCPTGYSKSGNSCVKSITNTTAKSASCPTGFNKSGNSCSKVVVTYDYKDIIKTCPTGYTANDNGDNCYKNVDSIVKVTGTKEVTYYRYRVREYIGGTTDYKWSTSKNDKKLLDAGYKLTGRTR